MQDWGIYRALREVDEKDRLRNLFAKVAIVILLLAIAGGFLAPVLASYYVRGC